MPESVFAFPVCLLIFSNVSSEDTGTAEAINLRLWGKQMSNARCDKSAPRTRFIPYPASPASQPAWTLSDLGRSCAALRPVRLLENRRPRLDRSYSHRWSADCPTDYCYLTDLHTDQRARFQSVWPSTTRMTSAPRNLLHWPNLLKQSHRWFPRFATCQERDENARSS